jgi:hypothetical protein
MEESVQTEYSAPVLAGSSFWNDTESLWHGWPLQCGLMGLLGANVNEAAHCIYGPPR